MEYNTLQNWRMAITTTDAFQRWTDLVMAANNTLHQARTVCAGLRLPWEGDTNSPSTPQQVRRRLAGIIPMLGTVSPAPQPRGKSPGRPTGFQPQRPKHYPIIRKKPTRSRPNQPDTS